MRTFLDSIIDHPKLVLAGAFLLMLVMGTQALRVVPDTSSEAFLPRGHVSYEHKKRIDEIYNINDPVLINITDKQSPDIFNPEALAVVQRMSDFIDGLEGIRSGSVRSLATREDIEGTPDGFSAARFLEQIPTTQAGLARLRERVMAFPLYVGLIVSEDGKSAGIIGDVTAEADVLHLFHEVQRYAREEIDPARYEVNLTGPPIVTGTLNVYLNRDAFVLNPISALLTCLILFLSFRSLRGVFLPFGVVVPSVLCALGSMGMGGAPFTPFSNAIPVVILATGISDAIHLIGTYYQVQLRKPHLERRAVVQEMLYSLWKPIVFTSVTTAVGFASLVFSSPMRPVQDFGITVAVGVLAAMVFSLTVIPSVLMLMPLKVAPYFARQMQRAQRGSAGFLETLMGRLHGFVTARTPVATGIVAALLLVGVGGLTRLHVDYNPVVFFPKDSAVYQDNLKVSQQYVGTNFVELHLDSGAEEGVFEPAFLAKVERLQEDIEAWAEVGGTLALTDYLKKMNQAFNEDRKDYYRLASTADANAQYFFLYTLSGDPTQFEEILDNDNRHLNLRVFLKRGDDSVNRAFIAWLGGRLEQDFGPDRYLIGGEAHVNYHWMRMIEQSVAVSVLIMSLCMFLLAWIQIRHLLAALFMILPVNMGLLLTYAVMGYFGIPVGLGTSIFAAIAIGIGVDYAIHFVAHYQRELAAKGSYREALRETLTRTGSLIVTNAAAVICGFLVLVFAKTSPPAHIGIFVAVGVGTSLVVTLLLLSVLVRFLRPHRAPHLQPSMANA